MDCSILASTFTCVGGNAEIAEMWLFIDADSMMMEMMKTAVRWVPDGSDNQLISCSNQHPL